MIQQNQYDFTDPSTQPAQTVSITSGTPGIVRIPITSDTIREGDETFSVTITAGSRTEFSGGANSQTVKVTIVDDDPIPTLTVANSTISVGEEAGPAEITFNLSNPTTQSVQVTYSTATDSAESTDFTESTREIVTIAPEGTSGTISIPITSDLIQEGNEEFKVNIFAVSNAQFGADVERISVTVLIADDDSSILTVSSNSVSVSEGGTNATIGLKLSKLTSQSVEVTYSTSLNTGIGAAEQDDFTQRTREVVSISNSTSGEISIPITSDTVYEGVETFTVTIISVTTASFEAGVTNIPISVTILEDDPIPTLTVLNSQVRVDEESGPAKIQLRLSNPTAFPIGVTYSTSISRSDTATIADFSEQSEQSISITNESTTGTIEIPIASDTIHEGNETFTVRITGLSNAQFSGIIRSIPVYVTITDDDPVPTVSVLNRSITVEESAGSVDINLSLSNPTTQTVQMRYSTSFTGSNPASRDDITPQDNRTITILSEETTGVISIPITKDETFEGDETFTVTFSRVSNANFGSNISEIPVTMIISDKDVPILSVSNTSVSVEEESGSAIISLELSNPTSVPVEVTYSTLVKTNVDTASTSDFTSHIERRVTILTGETIGSISIPITSDEIHEGDETFTVAITAVTVATLGKNVASIPVKVTINDNDEVPTLTVSGSSVSVGEESGPAEIMLQLSNPTSQIVQVTYSTALTSGNDAAEHDDFIGQTSGTVTIASELETGTISIPINTDNVFEDDETFMVTIGSVSNASFNAGIRSIPVTVTIVEDDPIPTLSVLNQQITEGEENGPVEISLRLSNPTTEAVQVTYSTTLNLGSDAAETTDFTEQSAQTITIASELTSGTISIPITSDQIYERDETFTVNITDIMNANFGTGVSEIPITVTIEDDENEPILTVSDTSISLAEDAGPAEISLNLSNMSEYDIEVMYSTSDDTAIGGSDFQTSTNQIETLMRETMSGTISIPITSESIFENDETFTVTLNSVSGATFGKNENEEVITSIEITVTIKDDDVPIITFPSSIQVYEDVGAVGLDYYLTNEIARSVSFTYIASIADSDTAETTDFGARTPQTKVLSGSTETSGRVSIPITADAIYEYDETFTVTISAVTGAKFQPGIKSVSIYITILDDDDAPDVSISSPIVTEGTHDNANIELSIVNSVAIEKPIHYSYYTPESSREYKAKDDTDYEGIEEANYQNFALTGSTGTVSIPIIDDSVYEETEKFQVVFVYYYHNELLQTVSRRVRVSVTIMNDDLKPTLMIPDADELRFEEAVANHSIPFSLSNATYENVQFNVAFSVANNDTISSNEFTANNSNSLTISSGSTTGAYEFTIGSDKLYEGDETFTMTITSLTGAVFSSGGTSFTTKVTVVDEQPMPTLIATSEYVGTEEGGTAVIEFSIFPHSQYDVVATYSAIDTGADLPSNRRRGHAHPSEFNSSQHQDVSFTFFKSFPSLENVDVPKTKTISITISDDTTTTGNFEGTEYFNVEVTSVTGATFGKGVDKIVVQVAIQDHEAPVITLNGKISLESDNSTEDLVNQSITITEGVRGSTSIGLTITPPAMPTLIHKRLCDAGSRPTVRWRATTEPGDTAQENDYRIYDRFTRKYETSGSMRIPCGYDRTGTDWLRVRAGSDGSKYEPNETFTLTILPGYNSTLAAGVAGIKIKVTIIDNYSQSPPEVRAKNPTLSVNEDTGEAQMQLSFKNTTTGFDHYFAQEAVTITYSTSIISGTDTAQQADFINQHMSTVVMTYNDILAKYRGRSGTIGGNVYLPIPIINDGIQEDVETFTVTLISVTGDATLISDETKRTTRVSILRNDDPAITVTNTAVNVDEEGGNAIINLSLYNNSMTTLPITVNYATSATRSNPATSGVDFTAAPSNASVTFAANTSTKEIRIPITNDSIQEVNETFTVELTQGLGAKFFAGNSVSIIVTILDNDAPILTASGTTSVVEDNMNAVMADIGLSLDKASNQTVVVTYSTSIISGTDTAEQTDFTKQTDQTTEIAIGMTSGTISIPIEPDTDIIYEGNEIFTVEITEVTGATFATNVTSIPVKVTITDEFQIPSLTVSNTSLSLMEEKPDGTANEASIQLSLSNLSTQEVVVTYTALKESNDTATEMDDFTAGTDLTYTIAREVSAGTINIPIKSDKLYEGKPNETFTVTLTSVTGATFKDINNNVIQEIKVDVSIEDNDPIPTISVSNTSVVEDNESQASTAANIILTLSNPTIQPVEVTYVALKDSNDPNDTAKEMIDFTAGTGQPITIASEMTTGSIRIPIMSDSIHEGDETFTVSITSSSNANFGIDMDGEGIQNSTVKVIIEDNDEVPTLNLTSLPITIGEGDGTRVAPIQFSLSNPTAKTVEVTYKTLILDDDTATSNSDFTATAVNGNSVTINDETVESGTISIPIMHDAIDEEDETFTVEITAITGANLGAIGTKKITITDNDVESIISVAAAQVTAKEGMDDNAVIALNLTPMTEKIVVVRYTYSSTSNSDSATESLDYDAQVFQTLEITNGTTGMISIPIIDDDINEEQFETFTVSITDVSGASFGPDTNKIDVTVRIEDNDDTPTISFSATSFEFVEAKKEVEIGIELSNPTLQTVVVDYTTSIESDDTAQVVDFSTHVERTVAIIKGRVAQYIYIPLNSQSVYEGNETFTITLTSPLGATFGHDDSGNRIEKITTKVTITDQYQFPTLDVSNLAMSVNANEGTEATIAEASIPFTMSNSATQNIEVIYSTSLIAGNDAAEQEDFEKQENQTVLIATELSGMTGTTGTIIIPIKPDTIYEGTEKFNVSITSIRVNNVEQNVNNIQIEVIINDNDSIPTLITSSTPIQVGEGRLEKDPAGNITGHFPLMAEILFHISNPTTENIVVTYSTSIEADDTAQQIDFEERTDAGSEIASGSTTGTITIPILADDDIEENETFTVTITPVSGATGGDVTIKVEILDISKPPVIMALAPQVFVNEDAEHAEIGVTLTHATSRLVVVRYSTNIAENDTAETNVDFRQPDPPFLEMSEGSIEATIKIPILNERSGQEVYEGNETFTVEITAASNATFAGGSIPITVTIIDDDLPTITVAESVTTIVEEVGMAEIRFELSNPTEENVEVTYSTSIVSDTDTAETADFINQTNELTIIPSGQPGIIFVPINDDSTYEGEETFSVTITEVKGAKFGLDVTSIPVSVSITDEADIPTLTVSDSSIVVQENAGPAIIEFSLSNPTEKAVEVTYSASIESGDTAQQADFPVQTNEITEFTNINGTSESIMVMVTNDDLEEENETFTVTISELAGAKFGSGETEIPVSVLIWDDDTPTLNVSSLQVSVEEGSGSASIDLTLSKPTERTVEVTYVITLDPATDNAEPGDLGVEVEIEKTVEITSGMTGEISIPIQPDSLPEGIETFTVKITGVSGANFNLGNLNLSNLNLNDLVLDDIEIPIKVTIRANNPESEVPSVSIVATEYSVTEGEPATFNLTIIPAQVEPVRVAYEVDETGDFIHWRVNQTIMLFDTTNLVIHTHDDIIEEEDGSVSVSLVDSEEFESPEDSKSAVIRVLDNDAVETTPPEKISVAESLVKEYLALLSSTDTSPSEQSRSQPKLPLVSLNAESNIINEGQVARFIAVSNPGSDLSPIDVQFNINPVGNFFEFNESIQISKRLNSQDSVVLEYQTIDDSIAEEDGLIEVSIINNASYRVAPDSSSKIIKISDATDRKVRHDQLNTSLQAFMPDVMANMISRTADALSQRSQFAFSGNNEPVFNIGGQESLQGMITEGGERINNNSISLRSLLGDSSFAIRVLSAEISSTPTTIWGIGDSRDLSSSSEHNSQVWSGDVFNGQIGFDTLVGNELLTGVSASFSENQIKADGINEDQIEYSFNNTSINPFVGWSSSNRSTEIQVSAGYGVGELTINQVNYDVETLTSSAYTLSLAGNKVLYSSESILNGESKLSIVGESWAAWQFAEGQESILSSFLTDAQHYRIRTEGTHQFEFNDGSTLSPFVSIGMRGDKRTLATNSGMEFTGSVDFLAPIGVRLSGTGSMLLDNKESIQSVSIDSSLGFDHDNDELGLTFAISPVWGQTQESSQNTLGVAIFWRVAVKLANILMALKLIQKLVMDSQC